MDRRIALGFFVSLALVLPLLGQPAEQPKVIELKERPKAPEFAGIQTWLNSPPLKMSEQKGKVVAIVFFAYS